MSTIQQAQKTLKNMVGQEIVNFVVYQRKAKEKGKIVLGFSLETEDNEGRKTGIRITATGLPESFDSKQTFVSENQNGVAIGSDLGFFALTDEVVRIMWCDDVKDFDKEKSPHCRIYQKPDTQIVWNYVVALAPTKLSLVEAA